MKRRLVRTPLLLLALSTVLLAARPADAHTPNLGGGKFGIGLILGEPTGLTLEGRIGRWSAIDFAVGFQSFNNGFHVHLDYLVMPFHFAHTRKLAVPFYIGIGGVIFGDETFFDDRRKDRAHVGMRFPLGIALEFRSPLQIFFEVSFNWIFADINHDGTNHSHRFVEPALGFRLFF